MKTPQFDEDGRDDQTFKPFVLINALDTEWADVRLEFSDWNWVQSTYGADTIDDYYLNGPGVEGLVKATLFSNEIDPETDGIEYNSEGDTCYIHFKEMSFAIRVAELSNQMITNPQKMRDAIEVAVEQEFDDG